MIDPANAAAALHRELNGQIDDEYDALCDYIADQLRPMPSDLKLANLDDMDAMARDARTIIQR